MPGARREVASDGRQEHGRPLVVADHRRVGRRKIGNNLVYVRLPLRRPAKRFDDVTIRLVVYWNGPRNDDSHEADSWPVETGQHDLSDLLGLGGPQRPGLGAENLVNAGRTRYGKSGHEAPQRDYQKPESDNEARHGCQTEPPL